MLCSFTISNSQVVFLSRCPFLHLIQLSEINTKPGYPSYLHQCLRLSQTLIDNLHFIFPVWALCSSYVFAPMFRSSIFWAISAKYGMVFSQLISTVSPWELYLTMSYKALHGKSSNLRWDKNIVDLVNCWYMQSEIVISDYQSIDKPINFRRSNKAEWILYI